MQHKTKKFTALGGSLLRSTAKGWSPTDRANTYVNEFTGAGLSVIIVVDE